MSKKILIVDDEEDMRIYLQTLLRKAGYETALAVNGEDADEALNSEQPDLITLDILMPKRSGLKFFERLREDGSTKELPVIVISGVTRSDDFFEKENLGGPTLFVEKPIKPDSLLQQVRQLIGE
jgi:CheY-like chemotaxis protein